MPLDDLIKQVSEETFADLTKTDGFDINDPDCENEAKRKIEYWLQKLVIRAGSLG